MCECTYVHIIYICVCVLLKGAGGGAEGEARAGRHPAREGLSVRARRGGDRSRRVESESEDEIDRDIYIFSSLILMSFCMSLLLR
jgi:hypothetical protein